MSSSRTFQLVEYMDSSMSSNSNSQQRLLLERDILLVLLMWETPIGGNDIGKISIDDFFTLEGQPILGPTGQVWLLSNTLPVGSQLSLRPNGTKTVKCQRSGPHLLGVTQDSQHCFLGRLPGYLQRRFPGGVLTSKFLFSPLTPNRREFADAPVKSTSIGHRLKQHLEASGLYAGESNHGFRRGQIQSMAAQGMTRAQIGEIVQIKTASIVDLYADVTRHVPRLQRLGKRTHALSCQYFFFFFFFGFWQEWQSKVCMPGSGASRSVALQVWVGGFIFQLLVNELGWEQTCEQY